MGNGRYRLAKRMRLAAQIIGFVTVGIGVTFAIYEAVEQFLWQGRVAMPIEVIWIVLILAMALAGCILSWRRERLAGILLISSGAAMAVDIYVVAAGREKMLAWLILGLPYLVAGVLLLNSWQLSKGLQKEVG